LLIIIVIYYIHAYIHEIDETKNREQKIGNEKVLKTIKSTILKIR